jgi:hypothetical protein
MKTYILTEIEDGMVTFTVDDTLVTKIAVLIGPTRSKPCI